MSTQHNPGPQRLESTDALELCNACEWRKANPNDPAGNCDHCTAEALLLDFLHNYAQVDVDQWFVQPSGLVACGECFCVFVPGYDPLGVQRYEAAWFGKHECNCHTVPTKSLRSTQ